MAGGAAAGAGVAPPKRSSMGGARGAGVAWGAGAGAGTGEAKSSASSSSSSSSSMLIRETLATMPFRQVGTGWRSSTTSIHTAMADFSRSVPGTNADLNRKWYCPGRGKASRICPKDGGVLGCRDFGAKKTFGWASMSPSSGRK